MSSFCIILSKTVRVASSDAFSELPNFALEGDFPEDEELIPKKTRDNNKWGLKVWKEWAVHRNAQPETYMENLTFFPVPLDLSTVKEERMNYWLARFITVRRNDGTDFPDSDNSSNTKTLAVL